MWYYLFNDVGECIDRQKGKTFYPLAENYYVATNDEKFDNLRYVKSVDGEAIYDIPLETFKNGKRNSYLKKMRDEEEIAPVLYNGHYWDIDEKSLQRINGAIIALSNGGSINWTGADNEIIRGVTADDLRGVIGATAERSNMLHEKYRLKKEELNNAKTLDEARAIKW